MSSAAVVICALRIYRYNTTNKYEHTKSVLYQCKGNNSIFIADLLQVSLGQGAPGPVERAFTFYAECHKRGGGLAKWKECSPFMQSVIKGGGGVWPSGKSVHLLRSVVKGG